MKSSLVMLLVAPLESPASNPVMKDTTFFATGLPATFSPSVDSTPVARALKLLSGSCLS